MSETPPLPSIPRETKREPPQAHPDAHSRTIFCSTKKILTKKQHDHQQTVNEITAKINRYFLQKKSIKKFLNKI
ncbi:hypothetical protein [Malikia spinosa]|uniref:hypothetical protein n=1 Tax=Malikia spinosa TaxID=86180 RepID=UPI003FA2126C